MSKTLCPSQQHLAQYVLGTLDPPSAELVTAHLDETCDECEQTVASLEKASDSVISALRQPSRADQFAGEPQYRRALAELRVLGAGSANPAKQTTMAVADPAGQRIGQYELLEKLGSGGMGTVYSALHTKLLRMVALKLLPPERLQNEQAVARFEQEMLSVGQLDHVNIVRATDAGEHEGTHFLVMEYVDGIDLSRLAKHHGPLQPAEACELILQAAAGLDHAHRHNLVHRDIKPSNLMLAVPSSPSASSPAPSPQSPTPLLKILDLGLARLMHSSDDELTSTGQVMGTLTYMAPEQADNSSTVDARADIYSLGATLYRLLAGRSPFGGKEYDSPVKILSALANKPVPPISGLRWDLPEGLAEVVMRMLAKSPAERYQSAAEVIQALTPFTTGADLPSLMKNLPVPSSKPVSTESLTPTGAHLSNPMTDTASVPVEPSYRTPGQDHRDKPGGSPLSAPFSSSAPSPQTPAPPRFPRHRIALAAGFLFLLLAGLFVLRLATDKGELVISSDDPDIKVTVKRGGKVVEQMELEKGENTVRVRSGQYEIELAGNYDNIRIADGRFTLSRGDKHVVKIERLEKLAVNGVKITNPDRRAAEWALGMGGQITVVTETGTQVPVHSIDQLPENRFALIGISLPNNERVTDAGLENLRGLKNLMNLFLSNTAITDSGLKVVGKLTSLRGLTVGGSNSKITDAGVSHLQNLDNLTYLSPSGQNTTDAVLPKLPALEALNNLTLRGVTNAGLTHLEKLPGLKTLTLKGCPLSGSGLTHLRAISDLHYLHLSGTQVDDSSIEALKQLKNLTLLYLDHTKMTKKGIADLQKSLPRCEIIHESVTTPALDRQVAEWALKIGGQITVRKPYLGIKSLTDADQLPDRHFGLSYVTILDEKIDDAELEQLSQLRHLLTLNLSRCTFNKEGFQHLQKLTSLKNLTFTDMEIPENGFSILSPLKNLRLLQLFSSNVADADLEHLSELHDLHMLFLSNCNSIRGPGLKHLASLKRLHGLHLQGTSISDSSLEHLYPLQNLAVLVLNDTKVTAAGAARLSQALPNCFITFGPTSNPKSIGPVRTPTKKNAATDRTAAEWVLSIGGKVAVQVKNDASWDQKPPSNKEELPFADFTLREIDLVDNQAVQDDDLARLMELQGLFRLRLDKTEIGDAGLRHLGHVKSLSMLYLSETNVTDQGLEYLKPLANMKILSMMSTAVTDAGLKHLENMNNLEVLNSIRTRCDGEGLKHLQGLTSLRNLNLANDFLTDEDLEYLTPLSNLKKLGIGFSQNITNDGLKHIACFRFLTHLEVNSKKITDEGLVHLEGVKRQLIRLNISGTRITDAWAEKISEYKNIEELGLDRTAITDRSVDSLAKLTALQILYLRDTKISSEGIARLHKALPKCKITYGPNATSKTLGPKSSTAP